MRYFSLRLPTVAVPLLDQAVVSAGTFLFNAALARGVSLADYGHFALVSGNLILLQLICNSLILFPLSIQAAGLDEAGRKRLTASALLSAAVLGIPLALLLTAVLAPFLGSAPLLPAAAALVAGLMQEATRRGLLAAFRYGAALPGDLLSYGGQAALLLAVAHHGHIDLAGALWTMAATSFAAALLQLRQIGLRGARPSISMALVLDFWNIGRWPLTSNTLGIARTLFIPWLLTAIAGPAAAGAFQIGFNLVNVANPIIIGVCNVVPQISARAARFGHRAAWTACKPAAAAGFAPIAGFVAILLLDPQWIAVTVYGPKPEIPALVDVIRLLAVGTPFSYLASALFAYLCGIGAGRLALLADIASVLAVAVLLFPLSVTFGLNGAAAALTLSAGLRAAVLGIDTMKSLRRENAAEELDPLLPDRRERAV